MPKILGIIPARYASQRFPGKPLAIIKGKPMIQWVYEQAKRSEFLSETVIATDDDRIMGCVQGFGATAILTGEQPSGTDRCQEAYVRFGKAFDFVINIQGDEPFIDPLQIDLLAKSLTSKVQVATLVKRIEQEELIDDPNVVKAVTDKDGKALYFSRSPIPFNRSEKKGHWLKKANYFKHLGIYAYRVDVLESITHLPQSTLEKAESLEQLRWLENGYSIQTVTTEIESVGIDTPEDIQRALTNS